MAKQWRVEIVFSVPEQEIRLREIRGGEVQNWTCAPLVQAQLRRRIQAGEDFLITGGHGHVQQGECPRLEEIECIAATNAIAEPGEGRKDDDECEP